MSAGLAFSPAVSALAGATVHPHAAVLVDVLRGQDGVVLDFARGYALQRSGDGGWLRPIGEVMDFARASAGGRLPAAGPYEMVGSGLPRYDHDPVTREPLGVRIESAVTPLSVNTANIAAWPGVTASQINRPSMFAGGVAVEHFGPSSGYRSQYYTLAANTNYRVDAVLERGVGTGAPPHFMMGFYRSAWVSAAYYIWGLDRIDPGPGPLASSGYIVEQLGTGPNGGKMVRVSFILQSGDGGSTGFFFYPTATWGSVAGQSAIVHYVCCSPGAAFGSPIIVGASAVTRAADRLTLTLPFDAHDEGITIAAKGRMPRWINPSSSHMFAFGPSTLAPRLATYAYGSSLLGITSAGTPMPFSPALGVAIAAGAPARAVLSAGPTGDYRLSINGSAVATRAGNALPAGSNFLDIGNLTGPYAWGDVISAVAIWRGTPFNNAALQGLLA